MVNENCVLLTGPSRSGTTLICHLLNKVPNTVALHEPIMPGTFRRSQHPEGPIGDIAAFAAESRNSLLAEGKAWTKQWNGQVPSNPVIEAWQDGRLRKSVDQRDVMTFSKPLKPDFTLAIKHNAAFTALLPQLIKKFRVFGIVRNPLAVLASWNTVEMKIQKGNVPVGRNLDPDFDARMAHIKDPFDRQLCILDWYFRRFLDNLPRENILEYEKTISSGGAALAAITPAAAGLMENLQSYNRADRYGELMHKLAPRLLDSDGAYWRIYSRENSAALLSQMR